MNLVLFGPPGAGKGTQSAELLQKFSMVHVSTGDLLREAIKLKTSLGITAKSFMDRGELVPDDLVIKLIEETLDKNATKGVLFDGFPRNISQAQALDSLLERRNLPIDHAVFLEVGKQILKNRLVGRRVCTKCGASFHIESLPPKIKDQCDKCGSKLEQRRDDTESVITNRLEVYEKSTAPLRDYYARQSKFVSVNGEGAPQDVFSRIRLALTTQDK